MVTLFGNVLTILTGSVLGDLYLLYETVANFSAAEFVFGERSMYTYFPT